MKFNINDKTFRTILLIGGLIIVCILIIYIFYLRRTSKYDFPIVSPNQNEDATLNTQLQTYQDAYNQAILLAKAMPAGAAQTAAIMAAEKAFADNIALASNSYMSAKCPEVNGTAPTGSRASTTLTASSGDSGKTIQNAWDDYTSNVASVQNAYYTLGGSQTAASNPTSAEVILARKADISGATRKYIGRSCANFFKDANGDPAIASGSNGYVNWTTNTGFLNPTTQIATTLTTVPGFYPSSVTASNVAQWSNVSAKTTRSTQSVILPAPLGSTGTLSNVFIQVEDVSIFDTSGTFPRIVQIERFQTIDQNSGAVVRYQPIIGFIGASSNVVSAALPPDAPAGSPVPVAPAGYISVNFLSNYAVPSSITATGSLTIPAGGAIIPTGTIVATGVRTVAPSTVLGNSIHAATAVTNKWYAGGFTQGAQFTTQGLANWQKSRDNGPGSVPAQVYSTT